MEYWDSHMLSVSHLVVDGSAQAIVVLFQVTVVLLLLLPRLGLLPQAPLLGLGDLLRDRPLAEGILGALEAQVTKLAALVAAGLVRVLSAANKLACPAVVVGYLARYRSTEELRRKKGQI
jgi:hypothetical protein